uniref:Trimethyllysine dioxygenase, mitochondrial n=1 Tax=Rhabditophanes sp. KR3021 TaxID=114890 RepID=A0AC35UBM7_9BILA
MLAKHCNNLFSRILYLQNRTTTSPTALKLIDTEGVELTFKGNKTIQIPFIWLRDHCRSNKSFNWNTFQRNVDLEKLQQMAKVDEVELEDKVVLESDNQILKVNWKDGHISQFKVEDILRWTNKQNDFWVEKEFWNSTNLKDVQKPMSVDTLSLSAFYEHFLRFGFATINNVAFNDPDITKQLCQRIATIHNTFFGDFWIFSNAQDLELVAHADTAYGNDGIDIHTDGTYFAQTPGIQVLHCLRPADEGGENVLVDGIGSAEILKKTYPQYFECLTKMKILHHYKEPCDEKNETGYLSTNISPIIEVDETGQIKQIRYNPYDRSPMAIPQNKLGYEDTILFYKSLIQFNSILKTPQHMLELALKPGTVMFIDNTRVLHARKGFKGKRVMCGAYLSMCGLMAKAKSLKDVNHNMI